MHSRLGCETHEACIFMWVGSMLQVAVVAEEATETMESWTSILTGLAHVRFRVQGVF
jgi:hypothetical protein